MHAANTICCEKSDHSTINCPSAIQSHSVYAKIVQNVKDVTLLTKIHIRTIKLTNKLIYVIKVTNGQVSKVLIHPLIKTCIGINQWHKACRKKLCYQFIQTDLTP